MSKITWFFAFSDSLIPLVNILKVYQCSREGGGGIVMCEQGQTYGDRRSDFGWWAHDAIHTSQIIEMHN